MSKNWREMTAVEKQELQTAVLQSWLSGKTIEKAAKSEGFTDAMDYSRFLSSDIALQLGHAQAREIRANTLADEALEIADAEENAQKARNQIDIRKWYAAKLLPKVFGDRIDLNVNQQISISDALRDAQARLMRPDSDLPIILQSQAIDAEHKIVGDTSDKQSDTALFTDEIEPSTPAKEGDEDANLF